MSLPTKRRALPGWATTTPIQPTEEASPRTSKVITQQQKNACSQQDVLEKIKGNNIVDVSNDAANGSTKPIFQEFSNLMAGVVFTISGLVNPGRTELRNMALDMGAQYRPTWSDDCTLLVCAFANTPTFSKVQAAGGTIVHKEWITECYNQKKLVAIEKYLMHMGKPWRKGSELDNSANFGVDNSVRGSHSIAQHELPDNGHEPQSETHSSVGKFSLKKHDNIGEVGKESRKVGFPKELDSQEDVQKWVRDDLPAILMWLGQQSDKPEEKQLEIIATQGLLVCIEDALKSLQENKGVSLVMDNWAFVPRAVKKLAIYEKNERCSKDQLIAEGERFKRVYESELRKLGCNVSVTQDVSASADRTGMNGDSVPAESLGSQPSGEEDKEVDDDATEIISDVDSRDAADFDTDDTEELDAEEIARCKETILQTFALH